MPHSTVLEMLVPKCPISDEVWLELIQTRRNLIKPYFDMFSLPELGQLKCMRRENRLEELYHSNPVVMNSGEFSTKTQGIFCMQTKEATEQTLNQCSVRDCFDGMLYIWGLTRTGFWVVATVRFTSFPGHSNRSPEKAKTIVITETGLPGMLKITKEKPERVWNALGNVVHEWETQRAQQQKEALWLSTQINIDDILLQAAQAQ